MIPCRGRIALLLWLLAAAPAAALDQPETVPLTRAIEQLEKKIMDLQEEVKQLAGKMLRAATDADQATAARYFMDRHRLLVETQISSQRLLSMRAGTGKGVAAKKTLADWIELAQKSIPKLPQPPSPPAEITDFTAIDQHARATPASEAKSETQLARYLTKGAKTDKEKARAIFTWIVENVTYDLDAVVQGKVVIRPDVVLKQQHTSCAGYTLLFAALAKQASLQASVINGWSRDLENRTGDPRSVKIPAGLVWVPHGWNAVKLDGKLYLVDTTWASGRYFRAGKSAPTKAPVLDYFLVSPEALAYSHFPDDPRLQQLKTKPLTKKEQEALPLLKPAFFRYGLKLVSAPQPALTVRDSLLVTLEAPPDVVVRGAIKSMEGQGGDPQSALVQVREGTVEVRAAFPDPGTYRLSIFARKKTAPPKEFEHVMDYRVNAQGSKASASLPTMYRTFLDTGAYLYHPLAGRVAAGKPQAFVLSVPGATEVLVKSGDKRTSLEKRGEVFVGEVTPAPGDVFVMARFPDDPKRFQGLIKFVAQ
jgi:hypothetical protein